MTDERGPHDVGQASAQSGLSFNVDPIAHAESLGLAKVAKMFGEELTRAQALMYESMVQLEDDLNAEDEMALTFIPLDADE